MGGAPADSRKNSGKSPTSSGGLASNSTTRPPGRAFKSEALGGMSHKSSPSSSPPRCLRSRFFSARRFLFDPEAPSVVSACGDATIEEDSGSPADSGTPGAREASGTNLRSGAAASAGNQRAEQPPHGSSRPPGSATTLSDAPKIGVSHGEPPGGEFCTSPAPTAGAPQMEAMPGIGGKASVAAIGRRGGDEPTPGVGEATTSGAVAVSGSSDCNFPKICADARETRPPPGEF
mmetsp:Transcript_15471/g.39934  ORF Transcript_15471/g.39934 Transcript_15471/m.39934 type:complete len:233 (-) Transcript_15471:49-747(-)